MVSHWRCASFTNQVQRVRYGVTETIVHLERNLLHFCRCRLASTSKRLLSSALEQGNPLLLYS
jgi:hypothetical protein